MNTLQEEPSHLKSHVQYPATKAQIVSACKGGHEGRSGEEAWLEKDLPEATYNGPNDALAALLQKV